MKFNFDSFLITLFLIGLSSCLNEVPVEPISYKAPSDVELIGTDTIRTGNYMGFNIGESAENTYTTLKNLKDSKGKAVTYLNVVSNNFTEITMLDERLKLYRSLFLDERNGTDSGVQITFEDGKIKSIYLNSGNKLDKWPIDISASSAVVTGDMVESVYEKLVSISSINAYKNKFERMMLLTKDVSKDYDHHMSFSPQWYFTTGIDENNKMDEVQLHFKDGVLYFFVINHHQFYR